MHILLAALTIAFVVGVLLLAAYTLFELSPFAHHTGRYHAPGERQESPRLD